MKRASLGRHPAARLALALAILVGCVSLSWMFVARRGILGVNAHVYYLAARAVLDGTYLYGVAAPGFSHLPWVYPPVVALAFVPYAVIGDWFAAFLTHTATGVAAGLALGWTLVDFVERKGVVLALVDRALVVSFPVASSFAVPSLFYGNVNVHLALALALGFVALDRGRQTAAGVVLAVPALVKIFPALVGCYLLRRRAWRAVAAATVAGVGAMGLGALLFGVETHVGYVRDALLPRMRTEAFAGGLPPDAAYVTVRRPLSVAFPDLDPALLSLGAFLLVAPAVAYCYRSLDGDADRLVAVFATIAGVLVFFPSYPIYIVYLAFPLVPLLYLLPAGTARRLFAGGAALASTNISLWKVEAAASGTPLEGPALAVAEPLFSLGSVHLYGVALMFAGCIVYRTRRDGARESDASDAGPDADASGDDDPLPSRTD